MKMGEYIRRLRTDMGFTQEELGKKLDPPVNRAAINKWEKGTVENIKRSHIVQLAKIFNVRPYDLMCFDSTITDEIMMEHMRVEYGSAVEKLLRGYYNLNDEGQKKLLEFLEDIAEIRRYKK